MGAAGIKSKGLVKITERDLRIFQKLNAAGWLTTRQIMSYFFPDKSTNAVCKRLRKLVAGGYLATARLSSTENAFYRLAGQGKLALIEHTHCDEGDITIPKQLPRKIGHFAAINDLRFCFEEKIEDPRVRLLFFFSEREICSYYKSSVVVSDALLPLLRTYKIIPDAIARIGITSNGLTREVNLAIEYDAGTEHATFFGKTKVQQYTALFARNYERLGDFKVLTFTHSIKRIGSLVSSVKTTIYGAIVGCQK